MRRLGRKLLKRCITIILVAIIIYIDARYIEPKLLVIDEEEVVTNIIPIDGELKIVQFSDIHLGADYTLDQFYGVVDKINEMNADIVIFTGDLIDNNKTYTDEDGVTYALSKICSKYGNYAVIGNHDHGGNGTRRYKRIMKNAGFNLLVNENDTITLDNGSKIDIIGIDDIVLSKPDFYEAYKGTSEDSFKLFLSHAPDVDDLIANKVDLQLSGHSHGGQVRIPIIGAPYKISYGKEYVKGMYRAEDERLVYVSAGIGTSQVPYRFCNLPSITEITLKNKK